MALMTQETAANIRKELGELQSALSQTSEKKEAVAKQKDEAVKRFSEIVDKLKKLKRDIDTAKSGHGILRKKRDELNVSLRPLIQRAKTLNEEKKKLKVVPGKRISPDHITSIIQKLETKIETEALSLTQEKKTMQKIHLLRKQLNESEQVRLIFKESRELSNKIEATKKEANTYHHKLQEAITTYKKEIEEFVSLSKEAGKLREQTEELRRLFNTSRQEVSQLNQNINQKLVQSKQMYLQRKKDHEQQRMRQHTTLLQDRMKEVEEKIRLRKKLTKEDLLVYQLSNKESLDA